MEKVLRAYVNGVQTGMCTASAGPKGKMMTLE